MRILPVLLAWLLTVSPLSQLCSQTKEKLSVKEVNAMVDRGIAQVHSDLDEADSLSNIVYYHSIVLQNDSLMAKTHALMGYVAYYRGNYSMSSEYYKKALESAYYRDKLGRRQALLNNLGVNYEFQHRYGEADQAYLQSLQISRQLGDSVSVHESFINLGLLNALLAKYAEAEAYLQPALAYFRARNDVRNTALCLRNLANLHVLQGHEEECLRYYTLALQEIRKIGTDVDALETEVDFNWALVKFKRYPMVRSRQDRIRPLVEQEGGSSAIAGTFHLIEGYYHLETKGNMAEAESSFDKAYRIFTEQKSIRQLTAVQEGRLALYAQTGNLSKHRSLLSEYTRMLEENYLAVNASEVESLQNIHNLEMQKAEIEKLTAKAASDRMAKGLLIALLAVISIAFAVFYRGYRLIGSQKRRIKEKNVELTELVKLLKIGHPERTTASEMAGLPGLTDGATVESGEAGLSGKLQSFDREYNAQLFERIQQLVVQKKLYLNPDLKIGDIADALQANEKEVSKAINDVRDRRFTSYINEFRIELAKELLVSHPHDSIKEITFRSGFSSQPQFQRKFKELTGLTPEQFRLASAYQDR